MATNTRRGGGHHARTPHPAVPRNPNHAPGALTAKVEVHHIVEAIASEQVALSAHGTPHHGRMPILKLACHDAVRVEPLTTSTRPAFGRFAHFACFP